MSLPFSTSKVLIGSPQTIKKVIGNGLIPFLAADDNLYVIDVSGNVQLLEGFFPNLGKSDVFVGSLNDL